jgi:aspartate kinase
MKFGGTSLESAAAIARAAEIVRAELARRPLVVVSAMGKTTDRLLAIGAAAARGEREDALARLADLRDYHRREAMPLVCEEKRKGLHNVIEGHFAELGELVEELAALGELTLRLSDEVASYGERLSSWIAALALAHCGISSVHLDARRLVVTDRRHTQATPLVEPTYTNLKDALARLGPSEVALMGGFIASTEDGVTTTLGRGGSDFTAALVGAALDAEEIQIWTDVDGMLSCDPALVAEARPVKFTSTT